MTPWYSRTMHVGDLEPPFNPTLYDDNGTPYNLSTATSVKVTAKLPDGTSVFSLRSATGNSSGQVSYTWQAADVSSAKTLHVTVVVEWTAGRSQTFPEEQPFVIHVI